MKQQNAAFEVRIENVAAELQQTKQTLRGRTRYFEERDMKIYDEDRTVGFYEGQIQHDLKCVLMPKYEVEEPEDFEKRMAFFSDAEHESNPHQRGIKAADLVGAAFWAKKLKDPALDTRVFWAPQLGLPHIPLVPTNKRPSAFWIAFTERLSELRELHREKLEKMGG